MFHFPDEEIGSKRSGDFPEPVWSGQEFGPSRIGHTWLNFVRPCPPARADFQSATVTSVLFGPCASILYGKLTSPGDCFVPPHSIRIAPSSREAGQCDSEEPDRPGCKSWLCEVHAVEPWDAASLWEREFPLL